VPSNSAEWMLVADHEWSKTATFRFKARITDGMRMEAPADAPGERELTGRSTRSLRLELELRPAPGLKLKSRIETVNARTERPDSDPAESGVLFLEEIQFRKSERRSLSLRWAAFDTDSYDSRLVVVENDMPGGTALIPLYKKGHRWTAVLRWRFVAGWSLTVKWGTVLHAFADFWGSGNDRVPSNREEKIGIQLDWTR